MTFEDFWREFPHCTAPPRSKKAVSRAIFEQITTKGRETTVDGIRLNLVATAEEIIAGARAYAADIDRDYEKSYAENRAYVPGAQVWLNQARWDDYEIEATGNVVAIK